MFFGSCNVEKVLAVVHEAYLGSKCTKHQHPIVFGGSDLEKMHTGAKDPLK